MEEAPDLGGYDAYLVGAATYATHWMQEAVDFVPGHRPALIGTPVWLFASGPLGQSTSTRRGTTAASCATRRSARTSPTWCRHAGARCSSAPSTPTS